MSHRHLDTTHSQLDEPQLFQRFRETQLKMIELRKETLTPAGKPALRAGAPLHITSSKLRDLSHAPQQRHHGEALHEDREGHHAKADGEDVAAHRHLEKVCSTSRSVGAASEDKNRSYNTLIQS